ncbi:DeoR/GlpR family DNA-binding transcription regulator [Rodentibacter genomosp. 2]|uniref:Transcriptional regulator n=1 Tax=Rodentibacter genomosp. 2 TaxID=1908266 RepID=A0A1V3JQ53_9PAST|nr:DeoR/GlpR family DNA-binding transcription regulator [Rodentibacter genomosp. 2]OOF58802.1 transcriptional regulator [Rodentibacter genomosp. 2]
MNTFERRNQIIELLKENTSVLVNDLAKRFNVSEVSIRTDLRILEEQRQLVRFHGGAAALTSQEKETFLEERYNLSHDPKARIAQAAAQLVKEGDTIILDSGSTTMLVAHELLKIKNITVITNNLPAAVVLSDSPNITLVLCGGTVRHKTRSMHGSITENSLNGIRGDIMFVGADGVDAKIGLTTFNEGYHVSTVMAGISAKVVAVVDSTKFNRNGFNLVLPMSKVDLIITDNKLNDKRQEELSKENISFIIV